MIAVAAAGPRSGPATGSGAGAPRRQVVQMYKTRRTPSPAAALALLGALVLAGCGLVGKDVTISPPGFQTGGPAPGAGTQVAATEITAPLSASAGDLAKLSSVVLTAATLEATDGLDLAFVATGTITLSGNGLAVVTLAKLPAPGKVGLVRFEVTQGVDLKPYLAAGGTLDVAFTYDPRPAVARGLKLTLVVHASL